MQKLSELSKNKKKYTPFLLLQMITCGIFCLWAVMGSLPTGWVYDIGAGEGKEQGQWPDKTVDLLERQEDAKDCFVSQEAVTLKGGALVECPLMRLRDVEWQGEHTTRVKRVRRTVFISEYQLLSNPDAWWRKLVRIFVTGGTYNRYFLMELPDKSYLCTYFDDYLLLRNSLRREDVYPVGYMRRSTPQERQMLEGMAKKYGVGADYVLDMYRHGKMSGNTDLLLRFAVAFLGTCAICLVLDRLKSCLKAKK